MHVIKKVTLVIASVIFMSSAAYAGNQQEEALSADVQASLHTAIINPIQPHLVFSYGAVTIAPF